jgi:hypothetical protein
VIAPPHSRYLEQLRYTHKAHLRVTVMNPAGDNLGTLPVNSVTFELDGLAQIRRSATIIVGEDFAETRGRDALEAITTRDGVVRLEHAVNPLGAEQSSALVWVVLATLRVQDLNRSATTASTEIIAFDRTMLLDEFQLPTPQPLNDTYLNLIERMIAELKAPAAAPPPPVLTEPFIVHPSIDTVLRPAPGKSLAQGANRLEEMQRLAEAIGGVISCDQLGRFTLAPYTLPGPRVLALTLGEGGTIENVGEEFSRTNQYNAVGIEFTPTDPDTGQIQSKQFYKYDNVPSSPTYYDGPFGRRNIFFQEEYAHVPNDATANKIATERLKQYTGSIRGLNLSVVYNPLLEPGDRISVEFPDGVVEDHIIDQISMQLGTSARMSVVTRFESVPGP